MDFKPQTLVDLQKGFSLLFEKGLTNGDVPIYWDKKAEKIPTPGVEINVYGWMAEMPQFKKWIGSRQAKRLAARFYTLKNEDYEFSYAVARNDIKYDRLGIYRNHSSQAGIAARVIWDQILNKVQAAGKTTKCYDGQFFYDTDHPVDLDDASKGTFANLFTAKPLTPENFADVYAKMSMLKDANGEPMMVRPNIIECNSTMRTKVLEAIQNQLVIKALRNVAGAENVAAAAVDNVNKALVEPVFNDRIEDGVWSLHHTVMMKPFIVQVESEPTGLEMRVDPNDPHVWDNAEFLFGSRATGAAGYTLPHLSFRCEE